MKSTRQTVSRGRDFFPHSMTKEQEIWNAAVDAKNVLKHLRKTAMRTGAQADIEAHNKALVAFRTAYPIPRAPQSGPTGGKTQVQAARRRAVTGTTELGGSPS